MPRITMATVGGLLHGHLILLLLGLRSLLRFSNYCKMEKNEPVTYLMELLFYFFQIAGKSGSYSTATFKISSQSHLVTHFRQLVFGTS